MAGYVKGWAWLPALGLLVPVCLYSHYGFASLTAHVSAMFVPFLVVAIGAGDRARKGRPAFGWESSHVEEFP